MLPRLSLGFIGLLVAALAVAACSSKDATQSISVGPSFAPQTLYAANVTQNALSIYTPNPTSTKGPLYEIAGGNTTLSGPQYLAFDSGSNLWVTNYLSSTATGLLLEFKAQATGDVIPYQTLSLGEIRPRGVVDFLDNLSGSSTGATSEILAVAINDPTQPTQFSSGIAFFTPSLLTTPWMTIAGPLTGLNVPSGLAVDSKANLYVTNLQGASVEVFVLPSPTPTPAVTPSPTPSPTPTPAGATASPSPTPSPTPTPVDIAPIATISGSASGINVPTGIAVDTSGNIYVSDQASTVCTPKCPAILIFPAGSNGGVAPKYIAGPKTLLVAPSDVKVDKKFNVYVADEASGAGVIYVFSAGSTGNVAPAETLNSPGAVVGLGLTP